MLEAQEVERGISFSFSLPLQKENKLQTRFYQIPVEEGKLFKGEHEIYTSNYSCVEKCTWQSNLYVFVLYVAGTHYVIRPITNEMFGTNF
jgi:hypothetical protein